jgi:hypothetical protein
MGQKQKWCGVRLKSLREKIPRKRASVSDARKCKSKNYYLKETCAVRFMSTTFRNTVLPSLSSQTAAAAFNDHDGYPAVAWQSHDVTMLLSLLVLTMPFSVVMVYHTSHHKISKLPVTSYHCLYATGALYPTPETFPASMSLSFDSGMMLSRRPPRPLPSTIPHSSLFVTQLNSS